MSSVGTAKHEVWRLFIAVELPDDVRIRLEKIRRVLQSAGWQARWTRPETTHLTLKFFGNRPVDSVERLEAGIRSVLTSERRFELWTAEMGMFPNWRRPRVIWLGIQDRSGALTRIASAVELESRRLGIEPEERPFRPHLTIARVHPEQRESIQDVEEHFEQLGRLQPMRIAVNHLTLYRSDLRSNGPIYTAVERFGLGTES